MCARLFAPIVQQPRRRAGDGGDGPSDWCHTVAVLTLIAVGLALVAGVAAGRAPQPWLWLILAGVTALVAGALLLPVAANRFGGEPLPFMAVTVGAWVAGLLLVSVLVWWLAARGQVWWAGAVGLIGALALVNVVAVLHVARQISALSAPRDRAWLWYWAAVLPEDFEPSRFSCRLVVGGVTGWCA